MIMKTKYVKKSIVGTKLLAVLQVDSATAARVFTKQELDDLIAALSGYELCERKGDILTWEAYEKRRRILADDLRKLRRKAFE